MAIDYTTTALIASLKRRGSLPTSQALFLDADFIALMSDELIDTVVPLIQSVKEEYFVTHADQALVADQDNYVIPSRAIGGMVRDVCLVDSAGHEIDIPRIDPMSVKDSPVIFGYYFRDDEVILYPKASINTSYSLRIKYYRRPNLLCSRSDAALITAINTGTRVVTLSNRPTSWSVSTTFDIIKPTAPFKSIKDDQAISAVSGVGFEVTFTTLPTGLAVGQWLCEAGTSPIPQIAYEGHGYLAQLGLIKACEAMKDTQGLKNASDKAKELKENFMKVINPRSDGGPKKVSNRKGIFSHSNATSRKLILE